MKNKKLSLYIVKEYGILQNFSISTRFLLRIAKKQKTIKIIFTEYMPRAFFSLCHKIKQ